jgi:hypothetical protein
LGPGPAPGPAPGTPEPIYLAAAWPPPGYVGMPTTPPPMMFGGFTTAPTLTTGPAFFR